MFTHAWSGGGRKIGFSTNHYRRSHICSRGAEMEREQNPLLNTHISASASKTTRSKPSLSSRNGRSVRVHTTYVWTYPRHWSGNVKICPSPLHDCSAHVWMYLKQAEINSIRNKEMVWEVWGKGLSSYTDASLCFLEFIHLSCTQLASILDGELYLSQDTQDMFVKTYDNQWSFWLWVQPMRGSVTK